MDPEQNQAPGEALSPAQGADIPQWKGGLGLPVGVELANPARPAQAALPSRREDASRAGPQQQDAWAGQWA